MAATLLALDHFTNLQNYLNKTRSGDLRTVIKNNFPIYRNGLFFEKILFKVKIKCSIVSRTKVIECWFKRKYDTVDN